MNKFLLGLTVLAASWATSVDARDIDTGSIGDDGDGHPMPLVFTPQSDVVYFKISNPQSQVVKLERVHVVLLPTGASFDPTVEDAIAPCPAGYTNSSEGPIRTTVVSRRIWPSLSNNAMNIDLAPCESILIRATTATAGQRHEITVGLLSAASERVNIEIWDGECND